MSCTGSQFCGVAIIETKNRAAAIAKQLEDELDIPKTVRMHWTGCPNSCGQVRLIHVDPPLVFESGVAAAVCNVVEEEVRYSLLCLHLSQRRRLALVL